MRVEIVKGAIAEGIATFALTFVGAAAVCTDAYTGGEVGLIGVAMAHGIILAVMVTATGHVSGGHVNPVVTLAAAMTRAVDGVTAAAYVGAQLLGATVAGLLLTATFAADVWMPVSLGTPVLGPGVEPGTAIFVEAVLTFFLVFVILQVALDARAPRHVYGLAIGLVLMGDMLAGAPLTGAAVNPARAFGPALASGTWTHQYVYWIGPVVGAVIATVAHALLGADALAIWTTEAAETGRAQEPLEGPGPAE
ncbi:MAG: MIP/aquaporin family protein [Acidobacteriota bacterium]